MREVLVRVANVSVLVFSVASMGAVGLAYRPRQLVGPLREARAVLRALFANFVLVPLLAIGIERLIPMDPPLALGLFLLAGAAGAPFLITLASAARRDVALSAALLLLLIPATVVVLPFYVPLAMAHPSLRELSYVPSSAMALGLPLLSTLVLPLVVGLGLRAAAPAWAESVGPIAGTIAKVALVVMVIATFAANRDELMRILTSRALLGGVLLIIGAFFVGFLIGRPGRREVLGLGTAQRNAAAAMVIASRDFTDPDILLMVTATVFAGLVVLFGIAWILGKRAPHVGLPTLQAAPT